MPPELDTAPGAGATTTAAAVLAAPGGEARAGLGVAFWLAVAWLVGLLSLIHI